MAELSLGFLVAAAISLMLTPVVRHFAHQFHLLDHPDGGRKAHSRATPVAGGLALLLSGCVTIFLIYFVAPALKPFLQNDLAFLASLAWAAMLICGLGILDDYGLLRGRYKLVGQTLIVVLIIAQGLRVDRFHLFGMEIELGWLAVPFTAFWLLGAINSLNLLDGMDGFLTSIAIVATMGFGAMACLNGSWTAALVAFVLAGALLGFLRYNFPPASIFLGDSGSMLIGLTIGVLAIKSSMKASAVVSLAAPLAILTLPILDTFAAIIRRKLTGKSIYATDRGHLHHCLANRGLSNRNVLAFVAVLSTVSVLGGLGATYLRNEAVALICTATVVGILVTTRLFGFVELMLLKQSLTHRTSRIFGRNTPRPKVMAMQLQGRIEWRELWSSMELAAEELQLQRLTLDINAPAFHEAFHGRWESPAPNRESVTEWKATIPIGLHGRIVGRLEVAGERQPEFFWESISKVVALVEDFEMQLAESLPKLPESTKGVKSNPELAIST